MKISIVTPTYNDEVSIEETLQSLIVQTYEDWEWIVVNDGSTDDTENKIKYLIDKYNISYKCRYIYQDNADQLNAIIRGVEYITGEFVFVLHSDDLLPESDFLEKAVHTMKENPNVDGLFGDLVLINESSEIVGKQHIQTYHVDKSMPPLMLLWLGRNLYSDVAFHRTDVYKSAVFYNYLTWNMPLWVDIRNEKIRMLNYKSVSFPVLKYRVHEGNYINNELGKMNVINGELRTAAELMRFYTIPKYNLQYFLFRAMNKFMPGKRFPIKYKEEETINKYEVMSFIIKKRYEEDISGNLFLTSLLGFYKSQNKRELHIKKLPKDLKIYYGKDVRLFNKNILQNTLEPFYIEFLEEMGKGFLSVAVEDEEDKKSMQDILKFLCIGHVEVRRL